MINEVQIDSTGKAETEFNIPADGKYFLKASTTGDVNINLDLEPITPEVTPVMVGTIDLGDGNEVSTTPSTIGVIKMADVVSVMLGFDVPNSLKNTLTARITVTGLWFGSRSCSVNDFKGLTVKTSYFEDFESFDGEIVIMFTDLVTDFDYMIRCTVDVDGKTAASAYDIRSFMLLNGGDE